MMLFGFILVVIGLIFSFSLLVTLGIFLLVVGLILNLVPLGGTRRRYW